MRDLGLSLITRKVSREASLVGCIPLVRGNSKRLTRKASAEPSSGTRRPPRGR